MAKKRMTRKELIKKPDEFITTTGKVIAWAQAHTKQLLIGAGGLFGLVILIAGFSMYNESRSRTAVALLGQALAKYQAEGGDEKAAEALAATRSDFQSLIDDFGGQPAGRLGRLFYGHISLAGEDLDEAVALYQDALKDFGSDPSLMNFILNGLGSAYAQKGEFPSAIEQFERLVAASSPTLKDAALFQLGRLYDLMGQSQQSQEAYQQLHTDFPESMYADMAREKITE